MRNLYLAIVYAVLTLCGASNAANITGDWSGVLDAGLMKLTLVLHISQDKSGKLSGMLDSPDQGAKSIEMDTITLQGQKLRFEITKLQASFEGDLGEEGKSLKGTFTQGRAFEIEFTRDLIGAHVIKRPQMPQSPLLYKTEEVQFKNPHADATLFGTLTLPHGKGPFTAVILIHGSGPIDRDESLLGHKPFWVLADHLTNLGIAVLRFDKRGIAQSTGNYQQATSLDFASDVEAALTFLQQRSEINPAKIGLIGHSEGGLIAPMVANQTKRIAFIVMMAGTGVTGEQILLEQGALLQKAEGLKEDYIEADKKFRGQLMSIAKREGSFKEAEPEINSVVENYFSSLSPTQQESLGKVTKEDVLKAVSVLFSPWMKFFLVYDPATALRHTNIPVLVLNGELDLQVPPKQNLPAIAGALKEAKNRSFMILELPKLNHLFQTAQTGSMSEYAKIEETIAPVALYTISDWIRLLDLSSF